MTDKKTKKRRRMSQLFSLFGKHDKNENNSITELFKGNNKEVSETTYVPIEESNQENTSVLQEEKVNLSSREVFVTAKILLESRELEKREISEIVTHFISYSSKNNGNEQIIDSEPSDEMARMCMYVAGPLLDLVNCINKKYRLKIHYIRQDKKITQRIILPARVMFSRTHMYLFAYSEGTNDVPVMYHMDRLLKWEVFEDEIEQLEYVEEGKLEEYVQMIKADEMMPVILKVKTSSLEKVFENLPTAEITKQEGEYSILTAEIYVAEILVWLCSQEGDIEIIEPQSISAE